MVRSFGRGSESEHVDAYKEIKSNIDPREIDCTYRIYNACSWKVSFSLPGVRESNKHVGCLILAVKQKGSIVLNCNRVLTKIIERIDGCSTEL